MNIKYKYLAFVLSFLGAQTALAVSATWTGTTNTTWATGTNWTGGIAPSTIGDIALFTGAPPVNQPNSLAAVGLTGLSFNGATGSYTVTNAAALTIDANGITNTSGIVQNLVIAGASSLTLQSAADVGPQVTITNNGVMTIMNGANATNATVNNTGSLNISTGTNATIGSLSGAGAVVLNGNILTVGGLNTSTTIAGVISGAGGQLSKSGTGTLTLTGSNTYTGLTTISAGTLQIGAGGTLGALPVGAGVLDNSILAFNHIDNVTYTGQISGTGSLSKLGLGTLTLTADQLYSGTTTLTQGALSVGNGGTTGSLVSPSIVTSAGTNLIFNRGNTMTYNGVISGPGNLTLLTGSFVLTGANTYTGLTTLTSATLQIGNGGATGSIASGGSYTGNGALNYNLSVPVVFNPASFTGVNLGNQGTGNLIITSSIAPANVTIGSQASMQLGNGGLVGSMTNSAAILSNAGTFILDRSDDFTFPILIAGVGQLIQAGPDNVTLTGNNTFTGPVTINAGSTLTVGNGTAGRGVLVSQAISNNGSLVFNRPDAATCAAVISGPGAVVQQGSGQLSLTGNSTFTGNLVVNAGSVLIANNSGTLPGTSIMVNNGSLLQLQPTVPAIYSGSIIGTGLVTLGSGQLTFVSDQAYTGTTSIVAGTLTVGSGGTTGSLVNAPVVSSGAFFSVNRSDNVTYNQVISGGGSVIQAGPGILTFAADQTFTGALQVNAGTVSLGNGGPAGSVQATSIVINPNTGLILNQSNPVVYGASLSGSGTLTKLGNNLVTFTGNNTFSGVLDITGGTVQLGNGGATGSIASSMIVNNGTLTLNRSDTSLDYSGVISGSGAVVVAGPGTITLSGANTYTGDTNVNSGTLQLGDGLIAGSVAGNIVNNAAVIFNNPTPVVYNGIISGSGTVQKNGAGSITLNGVNTYAGATTVNAGTLLVGGASGSTAVVAGDLVVNASGTLGGFGKIDGNLTNNGTVAPGASIGTLTVVGNYVQPATGTLNIEVNGAGQSDLLAITGSATIGGTLSLSTTGGFLPGHAYQFLTAANGITGSFANVNGLGQFTQHFIIGQVIQGANSLSVSAEFNPTALAALATSPNRAALVNYLLAGGGTPGLKALIAGFTTNAQFAQLGGEAGSPFYANQQLQLAQTGSWFERQISDRMGLYPSASADKMHGARQMNVWVTPYGSSSSISQNDISGLDTSMGGLALGVDMPVATDVKVGAGVAATYFSSDTTGLEDASNTGGLFQVGVYGDYRVDDWSFGAGVDVGGTSDIDTTRNIATDSSTTEGKYQATLVTEQLKATCNLTLTDQMHVRPFVGLINQNVNNDSFTETGDATYSLTVQSENYTSVKSQMGASFDAPLGDHMTFVGSVAWQHEFSDTSATMDALMTQDTTGTKPLLMYGTDIGRNSALVKVGLVLVQKDKLDVTAMYEGVYADSYSETGGKLQLNFLLG